MKTWLKSVLNYPIDIRDARTSFRKIALSIAIESGYNVERREFDPNDLFPDVIYSPGLRLVPESGIQLMNDLYKEAEKILCID